MRVSIDKAPSILRNSNGKIFRVTFIKRTNGELRNMVARLNVKVDITGTGQPYDPADYDLMTVYDMQKQAYRMVNLPEVISARVNGVDYEFE